MSRLHRLLMLLSLCILSWPVGAQDDPRAVVETTAERILEELQAEKDAVAADVRAAYVLIDRAVDRYIDFPLVARLVLGKHWRTATAEQQAAFTREFRALLVRFYAKALVEYIAENGVPGREIFEILPVRTEPEARYATVRTLIRRPDGGTVPVDYSLRRGPDGWRIYDVKVEGISVVTSYRNSFGQEIAARGLQAVIDELARRNREAGKAMSMAAAPAQAAGHSSSK